jgi:hypothetical protein
MNSGIVASAAFVMVLTTSGALSAREALSVAGEKYRERVTERKVIRLAENGPVPATIAPVEGVSDTAIALNLKAPMDGLRFILFRDIPPDVKFSHGFRVKNSWITSINDVEKVQIIPSPGFVGSLAFAVLFQRDSVAGTAAQGLLIIDVRPAGAVAEPKPSQARELPTGAVVSVPPARDREARPVPKAPAVSPAEEREELARGAGLMRLGDIGTARLIFQNLATRSSANGARALAETYDPAYLKEVAVTGLRPDIEAAKKWYRVAAGLGDSKSATRLSVLDQR